MRTVGHGGISNFMSLAGMGGIAPPAGFGGFGEEARNERPAPVPAMAAPVPTAQTMAAAGIPVYKVFLRSTNILANLNFCKCADLAFSEHKAPAPPESQVPVPLQCLCTSFKRFSS